MAIMESRRGAVHELTKVRGLLLGKAGSAAPSRSLRRWSCGSFRASLLTNARGIGSPLLSRDIRHSGGEAFGPQADLRVTASQVLVITEVTPIGRLSARCTRPELWTDRSFRRYRESARGFGSRSSAESFVANLRASARTGLVSAAMTFPAFVRTRARYEMEA